MAGERHGGGHTCGASLDARAQHGPGSLSRVAASLSTRSRVQSTGTTYLGGSGAWATAAPPAATAPLGKNCRQSLPRMPSARQRSTLRAICGWSATLYQRIVSVTRRPAGTAGGMRKPCSQPCRASPLNRKQLPGRSSSPNSAPSCAGSGRKRRPFSAPGLRASSSRAGRRWASRTKCRPGPQPLSGPTAYTPQRRSFSSTTPAMQSSKQLLSLCQSI